jgi:AraC-like DNA-binding protein
VSPAAAKAAGLAVRVSGGEITFSGTFVLTTPQPRTLGLFYFPSGTGSIADVRLDKNGIRNALVLLRHGGSATVTGVGWIHAYFIYIDEKCVDGLSQFLYLTFPNEAFVQEFMEIAAALENPASPLSPQFLTYLRGIAAGGRGPAMIPPYLVQARRILETRFFESITLDSLSKELFINKYMLLKGFKRYWHMTPNEYLTTIRLSEGRRLLTQTNLTISQIAENAGFGGTPYFIKRFKQRYNETPLAYRQQRLGGVHR